MRYSKPELLAVNTALAAIQGMDKGVELYPDSEPNQPNITIGAYEVDE